MKEYIRQFYNEGLATTFYLRPIGFISKRVKNKRILKVLKIFIGIVYTVLMVIFAGYMFCWQYPFC